MRNEFVTETQEAEPLTMAALLDRPNADRPKTEEVGATWRAAGRCERSTRRSAHRQTAQPWMPRRQQRYSGFGGRASWRVDATERSGRLGEVLAAGLAWLSGRAWLGWAAAPGPAPAEFPASLLPDERAELRDANPRPAICCGGLRGVAATELALGSGAS